MSRPTVGANPQSSPGDRNPPSLSHVALHLAKESGILAEARPPGATPPCDCSGVGVARQRGMDWSNHDAGCQRGDWLHIWAMESEARARRISK